MEQFSIYHNRHTKPRNRLETHMIEYIKAFLEKPVDLTIEQVKEAFEEEIKRFSAANKNSGTVSLGDIQKRSSYMEHRHIQRRGFGLCGRGRGTLTLNIAETIDKDANNNFQPAVKPW